MRDITILDMLRHGVHFGHQQSRRHPKMDPDIFTNRNGISIINLERTREALGRAATFLQETVASGSTVLFVGSKRQARPIIQVAAQRVAMPYVMERWIGGLFTNFNHVRQLMEKLHKLKEDRAAGGWQKYTKKEQLDLQTELDRLDRLVGGLGSMESLPKAMFVVDVKTEKTAVAEAKKMGIPIVAICDTNVNPTGIAYPIPANDDATKSIRIVTDFLVEAIEGGRYAHDQRLRDAARAVEAAAAAAAVPEPAQTEV